MQARRDQGRVSITANGWERQPQSTTVLKTQRLRCCLGVGPRETSEAKINPPYIPPSWVSEDRWQSCAMGAVDSKQGSRCHGAHMQAVRAVWLAKLTG